MTAVPFIMLVVAFAAVFGKTDYWKAVRNFVTIVHEFGHAVMVLLMGGRIKRFTVRSDTSGEVLSALPKGRIRRAFTAGAGYPAPSVTGGLLALCVAQGWQQYALYVMAVVATLTIILWVRNLWAFGILLFSAAVFAGSAYYANELVWSIILWGLIGVLIFGGLRSAFEQFQRTLRKQDEGSDTETISKTIFLPKIVVSFSFLLICGLSAAFALWCVYLTVNAS
jgi:hypothetical protein